MLTTARTPTGPASAAKTKRGPKTTPRAPPPSPPTLFPVSHAALAHSAPDLLEPHILRALADVRVASVHAGAAACHFVALSTGGDAFLFGRNTSGALGLSSSTPAVSEHAPRRVQARSLPGAAKDARIVHAACGRAHTLLVGSDGNVWSAGGNAFGQVRGMILGRRGC